MKKPDYVRYEQEKANLQKQNLSPVEYDREIRKIAKRCGV